MPIIAIDLDPARTAVLDAIASEEKRARKHQALHLLEKALDAAKDKPKAEEAADEAQANLKTVGL